MARSVRVKVIRHTKVGGELVTLVEDKKTPGALVPVVIEMSEQEAGELLATGVGVLAGDEPAAKE